MPPDLHLHPVVDPAPYWTWALVSRRDETRKAVQAAVEALTRDIGGLSLDSDTAWLPSGDPFRGAGPALQAALASGARLAVLKDGSPSCGSGIVHDGTFTGRRVPGAGVTATLLRRHGIAVFSETRLDEAAEYLRGLEGSDAGA